MYVWYIRDENRKSEEFTRKNRKSVEIIGGCMIFVFTPIYDYDETREVFEFENIDKAISFIDEHLKQNKTASFHNGPDDYIVVEGRRIKLKAIEYASKLLLEHQAPVAFTPTHLFRIRGLPVTGFTPPRLSRL